MQLLVVIRNAIACCWGGGGGFDVFVKWGQNTVLDRRAGGIDSVLITVCIGSIFYCKEQRKCGCVEFFILGNTSLFYTYISEFVLCGWDVLIRSAFSVFVFGKVQDVYVVLKPWEKYLAGELPFLFTALIQFTRYGASVLSQTCKKRTSQNCSCGFE